MTAIVQGKTWPQISRFAVLYRNMFQRLHRTSDGFWLVGFRLRSQQSGVPFLCFVLKGGIILMEGWASHPNIYCSLGSTRPLDGHYRRRRHRRKFSDLSRCSWWSRRRWRRQILSIYWYVYVYLCRYWCADGFQPANDVSTRVSRFCGKWGRQTGHNIVCRVGTAHPSGHPSVRVHMTRR